MAITARPHTMSLCQVCRNWVTVVLPWHLMVNLYRESTGFLVGFSAWLSLLGLECYLHLKIRGIKVQLKEALLVFSMKTGTT